MAKVSSSNRIVVDISRSRQARSFPDGQRLWQQDLNRVVKMIKDHVQQLRTSGDDPDNKPSLSIAIFGPAGSGKSSFLKTLVNRAKAPKISEPDTDWMENVTSLDILQPARFASGDHLIYAVVAAALDGHRTRHKDKSIDYEVLSDVLEAYRKLSDDLHAVHQENSTANLEPLELAAERVQRHTSGLRLRKKMQHFLDKVADDLTEHPKDSVILLPVDDLDLAPDHLYPSLRALQAYLLHARLVPIFTFTDRLAEEILIGEFEKSIHTRPQADSKSATRTATGRLSVSRQLAIQYLAKCFPVRNRLRLGPAAAVLQAADAQPEEASEAQTEPTLIPLIAASELIFGHPDRAARHNVQAALRPNTLRRQFQVIDSLRQAGVSELMDKHYIERAGLTGQYNPPDRDRETPWGRLYDQTAWALMNIHRDVLREYNLYLEDLYSWSPHALRRVILRELCTTDRSTQIGLWQRWRSLTDSRRSQVISLLVANTLRPWTPGEPPSGDDQQSVLLWRKTQEEKDKFSDGEPPSRHAQQSASLWQKEQEGKDKYLNEVDSSLILLWFANVTLSFYLPMSWSVHRQITQDDPQTRQLSDAGWSLHSAPIHAAQAAYDDRKIFATGMVFLDPLSYAIALTTVPRIAACAVLDDQLVDLDPETEDQLSETIRDIKLTLLSERTSHTLIMINQHNRLSTKRHERTIQRIEKEAGELYKKAARWEIHEKINTDNDLNKEIYDYLRTRDYKKALDVLTDPENDGRTDDIPTKARNIRNLWVAANTVHDDQLLLRIWTCYGSYGGRYWAAASLWRGLGLIGELIDSHRGWKQTLKKETNPDKKQEKRNQEKYNDELTEKIAGLLRTHCLKGLVPGMDLGGPNPDETLELAFSEWNTRGQRRAILRMAERLRRWLEHIVKTHKTRPLENGYRWSRCVVRRMHGDNIVGSFWTWLDAEHLEHQGRQYSKRKKYHWNAGLALTSWIRVLARYFEQSYEVRCVIETCPLTSPFLSNSAQDPFLASLREEPYDKILKEHAENTVTVKKSETDKSENDEKDKEENKETDRSETEHVKGENDFRPSRHRISKNLSVVTKALEALWRGKKIPQSLKDLKHRLLSESAEPLDIKESEDGFIRSEVQKVLNEVLEKLMPEDLEDEGLTKADIFKGIPDAIKDLHRTATKLRTLLWQPDSTKDKDKPAESVDHSKDDASRQNYIRHLVVNFRPRVEGPRRIQEDRDDDEDILDPASVRYEMASLINQHWKVAAHASTASLFYQLPRVRRPDFYDQSEQQDKKDKHDKKVTEYKKRIYRIRTNSRTRR